jgi:hypothetical protein
MTWIREAGQVSDLTAARVALRVGVGRERGYLPTSTPGTMINADLAFQKILDRLDKLGVAALTEKEKTVAAAWLFEAGVGNDGFARYFADRRSDLAFYAPTALRTLGAPQLAGLAEQANALFGPGGPPADRAARCRCLDALPESARRTFDDLERRFDDCPEDIDELLEKFLAHE